jgi:hypothetical protein
MATFIVSDMWFPTWCGENYALLFRLPWKQSAQCSQSDIKRLRVIIPEHCQQHGEIIDKVRIDLFIELFGLESREYGRRDPSC